MAQTAPRGRGVVAVRAVQEPGCPHPGVRARTSITHAARAMLFMHATLHGLPLVLMAPGTRAPGVKTGRLLSAFASTHSNLHALQRHASGRW